MNIKHLTYTLLVSLTIGFTACGSDSDDGGNNKGKYTSSLFQGQWCAMDGGVAMVLNLEQSSLTGEVYLNLNTTPTLYETLSGTWYYYSANDMMQLEMLHSSNGNRSTESYKVVQANDQMMKLREQSTGAEDVFYRLVGTRTLDQGSSFTISYDGGGSFQPVGYSSSNNSIATVDNKGLVTATGQGVAFISVYSAQDEVVVVKVEVAGIVENFTKEVLSNIDAIIQRYGTPDLTGQSGQSQAIAYRQPSAYPALNIMQYQYDESTREVTRILTRYNTMEGYTADASFVIANYLDLGGNLYGLKTDFTANEYLISPFISDGQYFISYNNEQYYLREGHF